jgi:hypothetical protein
MKHIMPLALIFFSLALFFTGCKNDDIPGDIQADFSYFEVQGIIKSTISILPLKRTIYAEVDNTIDLSNITPIFVLSNGATAYRNGEMQISGQTAGDFTKMVNYTIKSGDGSNTTEWTVILVPRANEQGDVMYEVNTNTMLTAGSYNITRDINVADDVYFALEPGVELHLTDGVNIRVGKNSYFIVEGTQANPIKILTDNDDTYWGGMVINQAKGVEMDYCVLKNGGKDKPAVDVSNCSIGITNTQFDNIVNTGMLLNDKAIFRIFQNNTMSNCGEKVDGSYPIYIKNINGIANLNTGNNISTNKGIYIEVSNITQNLTIVGQNCPFILPNDLVCDGNNTAVYISNGAKFLMDKGTSVKIAENSKVKFEAKGTASNPIIFTSLSEQPGYWNGFVFNKNVLATSYLTYCTISNAGNDVNNGAIFCNGTTEKNLSISLCNINNSSSNGIYFSNGATAQLDSNSFSNIGGEDVVYGE